MSELLTWMGYLGYRSDLREQRRERERLRESIDDVARLVGAALMRRSAFATSAISAGDRPVSEGSSC